MEDTVKPTFSRTSTTETRTDLRELRKLIRQKVLTDKEEQVIRMRLGVSEPEASRLQFRGQNHEDSRVKLALMERAYLEEQREGRRDPELTERKKRIIEKLRSLS